MRAVLLDATTNANSSPYGRGRKASHDGQPLGTPFDCKLDNSKAARRTLERDPLDNPFEDGVGAHDARSASNYGREVDSAE